MKLYIAGHQGMVGAALVRQRRRLVTSQAQLSATLENIDQGILMIAHDGRTPVINRRAVEETQKAFPDLQIVGRRNGYFSREQEDEICAEIAALKPDILWLALGVPLEQRFCSRNLNKLNGVGVIKTSGGLFDFVSGEKPRAPGWMQKFSLEWLFRTLKEPRRLLMRYLTTNPHALYVMLTSMR